MTFFESKTIITGRNADRLINYALDNCLRSRESDGALMRSRRKVGSKGDLPTLA